VIIFFREERKETETKFSNYIFAVAPTDKVRRNFKNGKLDATGVFAQLPREVQKALNKASDADIRNVRGEISAENYDRMTDIDGDGKVDLIYLPDICPEPETSGLIECSYLLMKTKAKWKIVGLFRPA